LKEDYEIIIIIIIIIINKAVVKGTHRRREGEDWFMKTN